jgi:hypothetical protein
LISYPVFHAIHRHQAKFTSFLIWHFACFFFYIHTRVWIFVLCILFIRVLIICSCYSCQSQESPLADLVTRNTDALLNLTHTLVTNLASPKPGIVTLFNMSPPPPSPCPYTWPALSQVLLPYLAHALFINLATFLVLLPFMTHTLFINLASPQVGLATLPDPQPVHEPGQL